MGKTHLKHAPQRRTRHHVTSPHTTHLPLISSHTFPTPARCLPLTPRASPTPASNGAPALTPRDSPTPASKCTPALTPPPHRTRHHVSQRSTLIGRRAARQGYIRRSPRPGKAVRRREPWGKEADLTPSSAFLPAGSRPRSQRIGAETEHLAGDP
ncbi:uncharacterized protein LOC124165275 [Ischnura elegans]|uniref:uncharacterized protein LOC124165275 n=1 Tax=Ischnura elegans TaxID=197161 RepID=UPI001ED8B52B|nr:uncharacterized protein LOC124165275 [Ischnura elegans]